jgi:hypothetical protein
LFYRKLSFTFSKALEFASVELKADKEVVLAACQGYGEALHYARPTRLSCWRLVRKMVDLGDMQTETSKKEDFVTVSCQQTDWEPQLAIAELKARKASDEVRMEIVLSRIKMVNRRSFR